MGKRLQKGLKIDATGGPIGVFYCQVNELLQRGTGGSLQFYATMKALRQMVADLMQPELWQDPSRFSPKFDTN